MNYDLFLCSQTLATTWSDSTLLENCSVGLIRQDSHHTEDVNIDVNSTTEHEIDVLVTRVPHRELYN